MEEVDRKFRLARIWSNRELKKVAHLFTGKVVNVSAGENIDKEGDTYDNYFTGKDEFWLTNYKPGAYRGYEGRSNELLIDLTEKLSGEHVGKFDVVFNHTTLEHVFDVFTAFGNLCALSSDVVIIVVPFAQEQHENPGYYDYWRFTPTCLRALFNLHKLEVIYESANEDFNAATYLFFIGSKHPDRWRGQMPAFTKVVNAANWIGRKDKPAGKRGLISRIFKPHY